MDTAGIIIVSIIIYAILGFLTGITTAENYTMNSTVYFAIGFFWPLIWFFGMIKMFVIVVHICWHMFFK
jgi:hypothetical protein